MRILSFGLALAPFFFQALGLKIACAQMWIEHTPLDYAANNFYKDDATSLINGGIVNLRDSTVDLAGNAETQGLKNYVRNRNYRLIGIIVEVGYRLVANKAAGISTLADLKGKRIGTFAGTSAEVFVHQLLASAGLSESDYTTVNGNVCMREPCGGNTFPAQLKDRRIDAFGVWETSVELGIQALGEDNVVVFKNSSIYREIYSLYSTEEKLRDRQTRQRIVQFVRALNQTYEVFRNASDTVYTTVAQTVNVDVPVLKNVWEDHVWGPGILGKDLLDFLENEDQYLARVDRRQPFSRADLERFVDTSVYEEAMQG
ncbi:putative aliphatic sulfonates-binding protein [Madurella mycetomatis]|uniref:Aliphatic sulfonates-binding protein n=1 Tax=Madurella mycetomatis TaxID=100816 RepID=A0A175VVJ3_9PEZI|nr:putative aliphatic sulfonates-binding protein [Madurella mycetomatis]